MAKLSERVDDHVEPIKHDNFTEQFKNFKQTKGETNMSDLRTINLTLVDNNPNLKGAAKIVFQKMGYITEHDDDKSIQQILMSGDIAAALYNHNRLRAKTVDKEILRNTGRDVMLDEVEIFDLDWLVVRVA